MPDYDRWFAIAKKSTSAKRESEWLYRVFLSCSSESVRQSLEVENLEWSDARGQESSSYRLLPQFCLPQQTVISTRIFLCSKS